LKCWCKLVVGIGPAQVAAWAFDIAVKRNGQTANDFYHKEAFN
jgi:hypothetical protein